MIHHLCARQARRGGGGGGFYKNYDPLHFLKFKMSSVPGVASAACTFLKGLQHQPSIDHYFAKFKDS